MSDLSVVLDLGPIKKAFKKSNFQTLFFNWDGSIYMFTLKNDTTIYVRCVVDEAYYGFLEMGNWKKQRKRFSEGKSVSEVEWRIGQFENFESLIPAQNLDLLQGAYPAYTSTGKCKQFYLYPYSGSIPPTFFEVTYKDTLAPVFDCTDFGGNGTHAGKFFSDFVNVGFFNPQDGQYYTDVKLIGEIASLLKQAGEETAAAFQNFVVQNVSTQFFTFVNDPLSGYRKVDFTNYKLALQRWLGIIKDYSEKIKGLPPSEKLFIYIDVLYRHNMLVALSVEQRIDILSVMVKGSLINWYFASWNTGFQQRELLALKIVESVPVSQVDSFLAKLITEHHYIVLPDHSTVQISLYKALFYRIDDYFGKDNFTAFVKSIERMVLEKNDIPAFINQAPNGTVTLTDLTTLTEAQFIWREKGSKKGRVKYQITENTISTLKIKETICIRAELKEQFNSISAGNVPVSSGFREECVENEVRELTLNHFDLVSIHFYENPSFIDLTTSPSYVGKNYFTYAGFIDYILEKEDTQIAEDVFNAALFVFSLAIGIGELIAAIRTINSLRAILGVTMITADTAAYLSIDTEFRNYIVEEYPDDYQAILGWMGVISTFVSLGTNVTAASQILNRFNKLEVTRFVGTAEAILKDGEALLLLTTEQIAGLREVVKKVRNELFFVRNEEVVITTISRTHAQVRFYKFQSLASELKVLPAVELNQFFDYYYDVENLFLKRLSKNPKYVEKWDNYTESEKLFAKGNKWVSLENEIVKIRIQKLYSRPPALFPLLDANYISANFGQHGLSLVNSIENFIQPILAAETRVKQGKLVLTSGCVDKETGLMSDFFHNYLKNELKENGPFKKFINNFGPNFDISSPYVHPNLRLRLDETLLLKTPDASGYNLADLGDRVYTGNNMGAHAEFRALNNLAIKKFGNNLVSRMEFDEWLETVLCYNRRLVDDGLMHTCADCFYLTDLVTFIK